MTLVQLERVVTIAREMNFRGAARLLGVDQPTLSISVKNLEEELGYKIFERQSTVGVIAITHMGQQVIDLAKRALREAETLKKIARASL